MNSSLWDLVEKSAVKDYATGLVSTMLQDAFDVPPEEKISHLAVGKSVTLAAPYASPFSGGGPQALTDGRIAKPDHAHPAWQGFAGGDLDAVIDLGAPMAVKQIQTSFLQSAVPGALLPTSVEYSVGLEANALNVVATITNDVPTANPGPTTKAFTADVTETQARFIRVHAINAGVVPDGLPEKGKNSMLLADEIAVR
jgi:hexosaminidase